MPEKLTKKVEVVTYVCSVCKDDHPTFKTAEMCENRHKKEEKENQCEHKNTVYRLVVDTWYGITYNISKNCSDCKKHFAAEDIDGSDFENAIPQEILKELYGDNNA